MIWLTSDEHYGHFNVIASCGRPFKTIEQMNEALVDNHNRVVKDDDTVIHVGDFSLSLTWMKEIAPKLKGTNYLVPGNHDRVHPVFKNKTVRQANSVLAYVDSGLALLPHEYYFQHNGLKILICHLPYVQKNPTTEQQRYIDLKPIPKDEAFQICGHVHNFWKTQVHESGKLQVNVGVDMHNFTPVSMDTVLSYYYDHISTHQNKC